MSGAMWAAGERYEPYVGRWSRRVAARFVPVVGADGGTWLDVGCGTGALTATVLTQAAPALVTGIDPSPGFVGHARARIDDPRAGFAVGNAMALPLRDSSVDNAVSGLVLNFVPDAVQAAREMHRVTARGGTVAAYVWDYADRMQLIRLFWDAAVALDPAAAELDEGPLFPICRPGGLGEVFRAAGLSDVEEFEVEVPTVFADFDDYWNPFLGAQGPAPNYTVGLPEEARVRLRERLRDSLPTGEDGSISLVARAWAVRARS
ncbi:MAG: class I SAM-dependent methyltransferase [Micromonosporaceae bacterium]